MVAHPCSSEARRCLLLIREPVPSGETGTVSPPVFTTEVGRRRTHAPRAQETFPTLHFRYFRDAPGMPFSFPFSGAAGVTSSFEYLVYAFHPPLFRYSGRDFDLRVLSLRETIPSREDGMVCALLLIARGASSAARWRCHPVSHSVPVCVLVLAFEMGVREPSFYIFSKRFFKHFSILKIVERFPRTFQATWGRRNFVRSSG